MAEQRPAVGIDATPLASGHAGRGIGRYLHGVLAAVAENPPGWPATELGTLVADGQDPPLPGVSWRTRRAPFRPQDLDPYLAAIADRLAIRGHPPRLWHHTDPGLPFPPLRAGRTIVTVYDLIPLVDPEIWAGIRPHRRLVYRRYLALVRAARGVIAISPTSAAEVSARLGVPQARIRVVPPHVRRLAPADPMAAAVDQPRPDCSFLFVGILESHKRPELAIATVAKLVDRGLPATLAMVGARPASRRRALEALASRLGIGERVVFVGRPDDRGLDRLYASSTLLATSRVEGFGLPPVEAILAGGRVAAVPIDAYRDVLTGSATLSADDSADALADAALIAAGSEPDPAARAGLAERFGAAATAGALAAAYDAFGRA